MDITNISKIRLASQQISSTNFGSPGEIVKWMGAIQAQDFNMAKWAIGLRLPSATDADITAAINKGEILRVHILRPTWHFVAADDIYWMLDLSAPQMKIAMRSRHKQLELAEKIFPRSNEIIHKVVKGKNLTREEIRQHLRAAKVPASSEQLTHLLYYAELSAVLCSGKIINNNQTYALVEDRVKKVRILNRDEALSKLAMTYFSSHGPATISDFTWWSGLKVSDARTALEMIKKDFDTIKTKSKTYWLQQSFAFSSHSKNQFHLLPAFDEFMVSYKDRSDAIQQEHHKKAFSNNGIFRPVIVSNGKGVGLWKRSVGKSEVIIIAEFFKAPGKTAVASLKRISKKYGRFLGKQAVLKM